MTTLRLEDLPKCHDQRYFYNGCPTINGGHAGMKRYEDGRFLTEAQAKEYIELKNSTVKSLAKDVHENVAEIKSILKRLVIDKENAARDEAIELLKGEK